MWQCITRTTCSGLRFSVEYMSSFGFRVRLRVFEVIWKVVADVSYFPALLTFVIMCANLANEISPRADCAMKKINDSRHTA